LVEKLTCFTQDIVRRPAGKVQINYSSGTWVSTMYLKMIDNWQKLAKSFSEGTFQLFLTQHSIEQVARGVYISWLWPTTKFQMQV